MLFTSFAEMMKTVKLPYAVINYASPIVYIKFEKEVELGFPEIRELTHHAEEISDRTPYFVLSDVSEMVSVTNEGRKLAANAKEAPLHRGTAVLVKSTLYQLAANFFSNFAKPLFPFRAFTDKQEAADWLLKLPL
jgi:hypothetical protein